MVDDGDTLPAKSVWRTCTLLVPSKGMKLLFQFCPLSIEYSTTAFASVPETVSVPLLVSKSVLIEPVSLANDTVGAKPDYLK